MELRRTGNAEYGRYMKVLFCGDPGSGKTLISSTFPKPLYASAEGGLMSIASRNIPYVEIKSSEDLLELKVTLESNKQQLESALGTQVETVVIDTVDEIARILMRERVETQKHETMQIADWGWLGDQMRAIIRSFRGLDLHVVFTCHLKSTEDSETGRVYMKPSIQGAVGDEIAGYVDLALLLEARTVAKLVDGESKRTMVRRLITVPDPVHPWIKDRSGKLPAELDVNFSDDFKRMNKLIFPSKNSVTETSQPEVETPVETSDSHDSAETVVTRSQLASMNASKKMQIVGPWECEDCGSVETNDDQKDLSVVKERRALCAKCLREAALSKSK